MLNDSLENGAHNHSQSRGHIILQTFRYPIAGLNSTMIKASTILLTALALVAPVCGQTQNRTTTQRLRSSSRRNLQSCAELPTNLYFQLLNRETHLSLHVEGMSNANGANVVYEFLDDGMHDTFRLIRSGFGNFYHIVAMHSNKVIAVSGSSLEAGANIEQEELLDASNQDWCFIPTGNGYYQVENRNSGQIIMADYEANVPNAGKNVFQWFYWGGAQQEWTLQFGAPAEPVDSRPAECMGFPLNTFVHLIAKHSGLSITRTSNGNLVQNTVVAGQRDNWHMVPGSAGHVLIMNQQSGLAISYDPPAAPSTFVCLNNVWP